MTENPFDDERLFGARSVLAKMNPDPQGRYSFEILVQYTRQGLHSLQVGDLVAVENYTPPPDGDVKTYSILTLTQVYPVHFATQGPDAYPGHIFEAMRSIKEDWEQQSDRPLHLTTTIFAGAVSTGWQFSYSPRQEELPPLKDERNLPMVGADVRPLSMEMVDAIINREMEDQPDSPFSHSKFNEINVKLDKEALLTTHFGIFGFTGVGKSNLVSSMVNALATTEGETSNVVLIDPNDEYLGLLIDRFVSNPSEMRYIHVGVDSLPLRVIQHLGKNVTEIPSDVVNLILRPMKLPARLKNNQEIQEYMQQGISNALTRTRIALPSSNLGSWIWSEINEQTDPRAGPPVKEAIRNIKETWTADIGGLPITAETVKQAINVAEQFSSPVRAQVQGLTNAQQGTANGVINRTVRSLQRLLKGLEEIPEGAIIPIAELVGTLNNEENRQTLIITARRDSELKQFVTTLGNELYESKRKEGTLEPFTVFLFDEADLFIPLESGNQETAEIKELCVTLARRGRKFGLGIGISTQRAALLDTEVMGNLHTYFISKLPRALDRQRVSEAFGIGEEQLSPTFTFHPGNWLIISHDATGLKGVPIPTYADDTNDRIINASQHQGTPENE